MTKLKKAKDTPPRPFNEIEAEFQQLSARAAQAQYQAYVYTKDLEGINKRLVEINIEAKARQDLDAQVKKELDAKAEAEKTGAA
jgi:hypothetical protein